MRRGARRHGLRRGEPEPGLPLGHSDRQGEGGRDAGPAGGAGLFSRYGLFPGSPHENLPENPAGAGGPGGVPPPAGDFCKIPGLPAHSPPPGARRFLQAPGAHGVVPLCSGPLPGPPVLQRRPGDRRGLRPVCPGLPRRGPGDDRPGPAGQPRPGAPGQGRPRAGQGDPPGLPRRAVPHLSGALRQPAEHGLPHEGAVELPVPAVCGGGRKTPQAHPQGGRLPRL